MPQIDLEIHSPVVADKLDEKDVEDGHLQTSAENLRSRGGVRDILHVPDMNVLKLHTLPPSLLTKAVEIVDNAERDQSWGDPPIDVKDLLFTRELRQVASVFQKPPMEDGFHIVMSKSQ